MAFASFVMKGHCYATTSKKRRKGDRRKWTKDLDPHDPLIPTCVPSGIIEETMKEGKKTCFGNESHTSRCSFSSGRSQTSHENGSTLLGSRTLGDHLPPLDCPSQSLRDRH